jgi:hypothetical protein
LRWRTKTASLALLATLIAASSPAGAELYRWVDENGVITYSDRRPAKSSVAKDLTVVEDRLSVYSPDPATLESMRRARERRNSGNAPASYQRLPPEYAPITPPPVASYDPCLSGDDFNCYGYDSPVYYTAPGFFGRHRGLRGLRSRIPPGTIAGNVVAGNSFTPGLSGQTVPIVTRPSHATASFTLRPGRGHRSR